MARRVISILGAFLVGVVSADAQGVYTNGVALRPSDIPMFAAEIGASTGPIVSGLAPAREYLSIDSNLLIKDTGIGTLGGYHSWSFVEPGAVLDPAYALGSKIRTHQMLVDEPFLIGIFIQVGGAFPHDDVTDFNSHDRLGRARLKYTEADGLTLVDSAMAYDGVGIIAGTTTLVPEPSTIALAASAAITLVWFRRRRTSTQLPIIYTEL